MIPKSFSPSWRALFPDLLALAVLMGLGMAFVANVSNLLDLSMYDETIMLNWGRHIGSRPFDVPAYSPFDALWYWLLSLVEHDAVRLFFLSVQVTTVLLPAALYLALRSLFVQAGLALFVALLFLYGRGNAPVFPKVSHLALIVLLLTVAGIFTAPTWLYRSLICSLGLLVTCYLRPEFFLAYVAAATVFLAAVVVLAVRSRSVVPVYKAVLALAVPSALCFSLIGVPTPSDGRSFIAFGQHFALNWVQWNHSPLDPWTSWEQIVQQQFGNVHSLHEAAAAHPDLIVRHVESNLAQATPDLLSLFSWVPNDRPGALAHSQWIVFWCLFAFGLGWAGFQVHARWKVYGRSAMERFAWIAICFYPPIISCIFVYPREHYLVFLAVALVLGAAAIFGVKYDKKPRRQITVIALILLALPIVRCDFSNWFPAGSARPELQRVEALRALRLSGEVHMLEGEGGLSAYLGDNYFFVVPGEISGDFVSFVKARQINVIVVTERLLADVHYAHDPDFVRLIQNPASLGFHERILPGMLGRVLVANSIEPGML